MTRTCLFHISRCYGVFMGVMGLVIAQGLVWGQTELPAVEVPEKAKRYHELLLKRAQPGTVFERFVAEWLAEGSVAGLRAFLEGRATGAGATTADRLLPGFLASRQNDSAGALAAFAKALEADPKNPAAWLLRAKAEARMVDYEAALGSLERFLEIPVGATEEMKKEAGKLRVQLLARTGEGRRAAEAITELAKQYTGDEALQDALLELQISEGLLAEAIEFAEGLLERSSDPYRRVQRRLRLGDLHQRADRREEALAAYGQCLDDAAQDSWLETEVLAQVERVFRQRDDVTGLAEHLAELVEKHVNRGSVAQARAKTLLELGQVDEALAAYLALLEKQPGSEALSDAYVEALVRAGRAKEAVEVLRPRVAAKPQDRELRYRLIQLLPEARVPGEAVKLMEEMLAEPGLPEFDHLRIARMHEGMEDPKEARRIYQLTVERFPESASAKDALASFLHAKNEGPTALLIWKKLAETGEVTQALRVSRALSARGEHEAGLEVLEKRADAPTEDVGWLTQKAMCAVGAKRFDLAAGWVRDLLRRAETANALDAPLRLALQVFRDETQGEALVKELRDAKVMPVQERCLLAELLEARNEPEAADAVLAGAMETEQGVALRFHAGLLRRRGDVEKAAELVRKLLAIPGGRNAENLEMLTQLLTQANELAEALKVVAEWKAAAPGSTRVWLEEARLLARDGRAETAVETLRQAVRRFEGDTAVASALAEAYGQAGQWEDAQRIYTTLFEDAEDLAAKLRWVTQMAQCAQRRGALAGLTAEMEERHTENPQSVIPLLALAEVHRYTNNFEKRRQAMTEAARLRPKDAALLEQIAELEESEGDWRAAVKTLELALPLAKDGKAIRQEIAGMHLRYGEPETGLRMMAELAGGATMPAREAEAMAITMMRSNYWQEAVELLDKVLVEQAGDYRLRMLRVLGFLETEGKEKAVEELVKLLNPPEELATPVPGVGKPIVENFVGSRSQMSDMPEGAEKLWVLAHATNQALSYRTVLSQNRSSYGRGFSMGAGAAATPFLPANAVDVPLYAGAHLMALLPSLPEERRAELGGELKAAGLGPANLTEAYEVVVNQGYSSLVPKEDRFEQMMEDELYVYVYVQNQGRNQGSEDREERLKQIVNKLRESRPELAFSALMALCQTAPESLEKYGAELVVMMDKLEGEKGKYASQWVTYLLARQPAGKREESAVFKELLAAAKQHHERNKELMLKEAGANQKSALSGRRYVQTMLHALGGEWNDAVALVEEEREAAEKDANVRQQVGYYYGNQSADIRALSFSQLSQTGGVGQYSWVSSFFNALAGSGPFSVADREAVVAAIKNSGNEKLKLDALIALEAEEDYKELILEQAKQPEVALKGLMLAASLASEEDEHAKAFELLLRARPQVSSTDERSQVEGALVHAALELKKEGKEELVSAQAETVKKALLQLRHLMSGSSRSDLEELAEAMEKFDLNEQSASLKKMLAAQQQTRSSSSRASVAGIDSDEFEKAVKSGKVDAAISMAAAALRRLADGALVPQNYNAAYEARNWAREIREAKQTDAVWKACQPAGGTVTFRQHAQLGFIGGWLGKMEAAREHLVECVKVRPRDAVFRLRLITALLGMERPVEEAVAEWKAIDERELPQVASQWVNDLDNVEEEKMAHRLRLAAFATLLNREEKAAHAEVVGMLTQQVLRRLTERIYANRDDEHEGYPPLLIRADKLKEWEQNGSKHATPEQLKKREVAVVELAEAAVKSDSVMGGTEGMRLLITLAQRDGDEVRLDELLERAMALVEATAARKRMDRGYSQYGYGYSFSSSDSDEWRMPQLGEFILGRSFEKGRAVKADAKWIGDLALVERPEAVAFYRALAELYGVPETEFVERAIAMQKAHANFLNQGQNHGAKTLLEVWRKRKLKVSPGPLVLASYRQEIERGNYPSESGLVEAARMMGESPDRAALIGFLEELGGASLGVEQKEVAAYVEKHGDAEGNHNQRSPSWRVQMYWRALEVMASEVPELAGALISVALKSGFHRGDFNVSGLFYHVTKRKDGDWVKRTLGLLDEVGLLRDLPEFDPMPLGVGGQKTVCQEIAGFLRGDDELAKKLRLELEKRKTFGARMVLQGARTSWNSGQWNELRPYAAAFGKLPQEKRLVIAGVVNMVYQPTYDQLAPNDRAKLEGPLKPFFESLNVLANEKMKRLATAKTFDELGMNESKFMEQVRDLVRRLAKNDPVAAAEQVERAVTLIQERQRKGDWRGTTATNGYNQASSLLEKISSDGNSSRVMIESAVANSAVAIDHRGPTYPGCFELLLDLFTRPEQRLYGHMTWHFAYGWGAALEQAYGKAGGWGAPGDPEAVAALTAPFVPTLKRGSADLAVIAYYDLLMRVPPWLVRRTAEAMRKNVEMAPLAEALEVALALSAVNGFAGEPQPRDAEWPKGMEGERERMLGWINDEAVNPLVRCALAAFVVRYSGHLRGSEELVMRAMELACESLDQRWPITALAWQDTVHAFNRLDTKAEAWKGMAQRYLAAFHRRCADDDESRSRGRGYWPIKSAVIAGLELTLLLGDEKEVNRWIEAFGDEFEKNVGAVMLLVRHGFGKQASVIAERIVDGCDGGDFSRGLHHCYRFEDAAALEKALPSFRTPLSAMVARVAMATTPRYSHVVGVGDAASPAWGERLEAVAKEAVVLGDAHPEAIRHLFQHLESSPGAVAVMADWATNRSGETMEARLEKLVKATRYTTSEFRYLTAEAVAALHEKGDAGPWKAMVKKVAAAFGKDKKKRADNLHGLGLQLMKLSHPFMRGRPAAELLPLTEAAEALAEVYDYESSVFSGVSGPWLMRQLILELNGREDDAAKRPELKRFLELAKRRRIEVVEVRELLFNLCVGDERNTKARTLEERVKMVVPVLTGETVATAGLEASMNPLQAERGRSLLTGAEMRQHAAVLASTSWSVRNLPMLLQVFDEEGDVAGALALLGAVAGQSGELDVRHAQALLSAAAYAVEQKKPDLARALLKRMPKLESAKESEIKAALEGLRFQLK